MSELQAVFGHLFPGLEQMDQSSNPNKRPKPDPETQPLPRPKGRGKGKAGKGKSKARAGGWSSSWDTQSTDLDNTVYALARLCLRQEEELTELRQEKGFLLHMTTSQYGVLKPLSPIFDRMEQHARRREGHLQSAHLSLSLDDTRAHCEVEKGLGVPAEHFRGHQGTLGDREPTEMVVPPLERLEQAGGGLDSGRPPAGPATLPSRGHGCGVETGLDCPLPVQGSAPAQRGDAGRVSTFQNLGGATRACGCEPSPGLCRPRWLRGPSTDRGQSASREAETMQRSQPGAGVRLRSPFLRTKLLNPPGANACYINSTMLSLLHTCHHLQDSDALLGRMSTIRQAIQQNRRPILLRDMLTFRRLLSDWRAPTQQRDIGEFFQYLTQAGSMQLEQHSWQAREMRGEQLRVLDTGHLGTPIPLDIAFARLIPEQPHTVQDCVINHFRGQAALVALTSAAPFLCLQLKRFNFQGAIRKDTQVIEWVERILEVPVWCNDSQLHTRDTRYQVLAIAVHRGDTPHSGHYQTCLIEHSQE